MAPTNYLVQQVLLDRLLTVASLAGVTLNVSAISTLGFTHMTYNTECHRRKVSNSNSPTLWMIVFILWKWK